MSTRIEALRFKAYADIDGTAGSVRQSLITDVAGQQAVYLEKRAQATQFLADVAASPADAVPGPYIREEANATGKTFIETARTVLETSARFLTEQSPAIEAARVAGKAKVRAATTPEDVEAERAAAVAAIIAILEA